MAVPLITTVTVDISKLVGDKSNPPYTARVTPPQWLTLDKMAEIQKGATLLSSLSDDSPGDAADKIADPVIREQIEQLFSTIIVAWNLELEDYDDAGNLTPVKLDPPRKDPTSIWKLPILVLGGIISEAGEIAEGMGLGVTAPLASEKPSSGDSPPPPPSMLPVEAV